MVRARVVGTDLGFTEGPVITQAGDHLVTAIDRGCIYRVGPDGPSVFAVTGGGPNGAVEGPTADGSTLLYVAQNGGTRPAHRWPHVTGGIQAVRSGGLVHWVTQDPVSPNDLCFGPDGRLYVTDPTRGRPARDDGRLWRCDPASGDAELLCSLGWYPNGIAFGIEDDAIYVASTGEELIWRVPLIPGGVGRPEAFARTEPRMPDGLCFDADGSLVVAAVGTDGRPGQIQTYDRNGKMLDAFEPGTSAKLTNVALSPSGTMLITDADAGQALVVDDWPTVGLALHPFRAAA